MPDATVASYGPPPLGYCWGTLFLVAAATTRKSHRTSVESNLGHEAPPIHVALAFEDIYGTASGLHAFSSKVRVGIGEDDMTQKQLEPRADGELNEWLTKSATEAVPSYRKKTGDDAATSRSDSCTARRMLESMNVALGA